MSWITIPICSGAVAFLSSRWPLARPTDYIAVSGIYITPPPAHTPEAPNRKRWLAKCTELLPLQQRKCNKRASSQRLLRIIMHLLNWMRLGVLGGSRGVKRGGERWDGQGRRFILSQGSETERVQGWVWFFFSFYLSPKTGKAFIDVIDVQFVVLQWVEAAVHRNTLYCEIMFQAIYCVFFSFFFFDVFSIFSTINSRHSSAVNADISTDKTN